MEEKSSHSSGNPSFLEKAASFCFAFTFVESDIQSSELILSSKTRVMLSTISFTLILAFELKFFSTKAFPKSSPIAELDTA